MSKLNNLVEKIRESDVYNDLRAKYDELDSQAKVYVNLGAAAAVVAIVVGTVFVAMAKVGGLQRTIEEREELIGYLQRSADSIKQLRAQQAAASGDVSSPLPSLVDNALENMGLAEGKAEVGEERQGVEDKESVEALVDVTLTQVNLRQLSQLLFALTERGAARGLNIKNLVVDTKGDPNGYLDATVTVAAYKAK